VKTQGHRNKNATSELISTHCGFNPFLLGSFINSHEIKIGLPTFAPFFHHFFKTKYLSETKSSGKGQSCFFIFTFFLQMCGWLHCATIFLHTKKELYKKRHIFFYIIIIVSWIQKWDFISHFSYSFFFFYQYILLQNDM